MTNLSSKHHYVQAEHIRQFTNERNTVHVYSKNGHQFESSARGIYYKRGLNSYEAPEGIDSSFEILVTAVENECWPTITRTIRSKNINENDLPDVLRYVAMSRMRNPSVQNGIVEFHRQTFETTAKLMDQAGEFDKFGQNPIFPKKSLSDMLEDGFIDIKVNNSVYLEKFGEMTERFEQLLLNGYGWSLVESSRGRVVISDHPLTYIHPGENPGAYGIPAGGQTCEMAFPLSKSLYLVGKWERKLDHLISDDAVDELNDYRLAPVGSAM